MHRYYVTYEAKSSVVPRPERFSLCYHCLHRAIMASLHKAVVLLIFCRSFVKIADEL